jgi:hypothetical protein
LTTLALPHDVRQKDEIVRQLRQNPDSCLTGLSGKVFCMHTSQRMGMGCHLRLLLEDGMHAQIQRAGIIALARIFDQRL